MSQKDVDFFHFTIIMSRMRKKCHFKKSNNRIFLYLNQTFLLKSTFAMEYVLPPFAAHDNFLLINRQWVMFGRWTVFSIISSFIFITSKIQNGDILVGQLTQVVFVKQDSVGTLFKWETDFVFSILDKLQCKNWRTRATHSEVKWITFNEVGQLVQQVSSVCRIHPSPWRPQSESITSSRHCFVYVSLIQTWPNR